jgi:dTDP-4-dehydrorhamnose reductase
MKLLVIGSTGQIGKEIVELLECKSAPYHAPNRFELDMASQDSIDDYFKKNQFDVVINASAYTNVDASEDNKQLALSLNAEAVQILAKNAEQYNIPIIHISTDYIFDGSKKAAYVEADLGCPINYYGITKLLGEQHLVNSNSAYVILRTSWVFGRHGNNFVKTMLSLANTEKTIEVVNDQIGCPTPAKEIAKVILILSKKLLSKRIAKKVYHYSGERSVSWFEFAKQIFDTAYENKLIERRPQLKAVKTSEYKVNAIRPLNSCLDNQKIQRELGVAKCEWIEGLVGYICESK